MLRDSLIEHVTSRACEVLGIDQEVGWLTIHTDHTEGLVYQTIVLTFWNGDTKKVMV